jgi:alpha-1,2-mannosyltransferase
MTERSGRLFAVAFVAYAAVAIVLGTHKGGDFYANMLLGERWLQGQPLYAAPVDPALGAPWPPFTTFALAPFALLARLSVTASKLAWTAVSVACLGWSAAIARRWARDWGVVALALLAVAMPIEGNVEHGNLALVLLAVLMAALVEWDAGRDTRAGLWLGVAAALKAYPLALVAYAAYRRRWRVVAAGGVATVVLTGVPLLRYGWAGAAPALIAWLRLGREAGTRVRVAGQSLQGLVARMGGSPLLTVGVALACLIVTAVVLSRLREPLSAPRELGAVALAATMCAPIAWPHGYVLAFPAWIALLGRRPAVHDARVWRAALAFAAVLTSGVLTYGTYAWRQSVLATSIYVWGGLFILVLLLLPAVTAPPAHPSGSPPATPR